MSKQSISKTSAVQKSCGCNDACSLPTEGKQQRLKFVKEKLSAHLKTTQQLDDGQIWLFNKTESVKQDLETLLELEKQCCGGLDWKLKEDNLTNELRLSVRGIDPQSKLLLDVFPTKRIGKKISLKLGAISLLAACVIACSAPIALAFVAGGASIPPLLLLFDSPILIGGVAIMVTASVLLISKFRRARR